MQSIATALAGAISIERHYLIRRRYRRKDNMIVSDRTANVATKMYQLLLRTLTSLLVEM